jgi:16S rRNA (cytosine1402-N4)-methyltransferase
VTGPADRVSEPGFRHVPVMVREVVELLDPVPAGVVVDATVGGGGHAGEILRARPDLHLLGIDRDPAAVAAASEALAPFGDRARVVRGGFESIGEIVGGGAAGGAGGDASSNATETGSATSEGNIVGILFDLGVSSPQLDRPVRGFSYWVDDAPLDMRMDSAQELTAARVVNEYDEAELAALIARNGEERYARRIAAEIVAARPLRDTGALVDAVKRAIPAPARRRGGHPARRTFQAIRMEVNQELPNLAAGLDESVHVLAPGGRMLVLAYHSLEDRLVKERFADWSSTEEPGYTPAGLPRRPRNPVTRLLTRRPRRPAPDELAANPRASSARLRAVEKLRS